MYKDNEGTKSLDETPQGSHRSKHIDVRFYFLRDLVRLGQVTICSVIRSVGVASLQDVGTFSECVKMPSSILLYGLARMSS